MKKLLLLLCAALAFAACNNDDDEIRFAETNTKIENGSLTGSNMHFFGTATATAANGSVYVDRQAEFEFAGLNDFTLYMHRTRFAAAMPALEIRLYAQPYIPGTGDALSFDLERVVPEMRLPNEVGGGYAWKPMEAYTLTGVKGSVDGVTCRVSFSCDVPGQGGAPMTYEVTYEGKLKE
ncbi:MAG: hypothetical protein K2N04_03940 [Alistipes sp.]|nr:hypothetical protein [Alistipes sp.]